MFPGEVVRLTAVLLAQQSQGLGAELSTAQTSGVQVGLRLPRRAQLSVLLWEPRCRLRASSNQDEK